MHSRGRDAHSTASADKHPEPHCGDARVHATKRTDWNIIVFKEEEVERTLGLSLSLFPP